MCDKILGRHSLSYMLCIILIAGDLYWVAQPLSDMVASRNTGGVGLAVLPRLPWYLFPFSLRHTPLPQRRGSPTGHGPTSGERVVGSGYIRSIPIVVFGDCRHVRDARGSWLVNEDLEVEPYPF